MRLGLFGTGRLGSAIADAAREASNVDLAWQVDLQAPPDTAVDVAIDATVAEAVSRRVDWAVEHGVDLVIGTTGWTLPDLEASIDGRIGVLVSPNFSLTVALMARFSRILGAYASVDADRDPYVLDHHHRLKADAPSGTALRLAQSVLTGCPRKSGWSVGGHAPEQLNVAVLRAGSEFGRHTVGFDAPFETFEITHHARSRRVFAEGALAAARFLKGRKGLFTMDDLAADLLDPLFQQVLS